MYILQSASCGLRPSEERLVFKSDDFRQLTLKKESEKELVYYKETTTMTQTLKARIGLINTQPGPHL